MTKGTPEDIEYAEQARIAAAAVIERITVSIINLICYMAFSRKVLLSGLT